MLLRTYLKCVKDKYMVTFVSLMVKNIGCYGKLIASVVPANLLGLDLADSGQLPCGHPEHLHLCSPACQQLPIRGEVDVVFLKPI